VVKNGLVIDPSRGSQSRADIGIKNGVIEEVKKGIPESDAISTIEAKGKMVLPGLVDLHVHVFEGVSHYGINADQYCLKSGATTVMDAGSAGADTFQGFRRYVIDVSETRIFAMLNISSSGMISPVVGELEDIRQADVQKAVRVCEKNKDVIMGIKVRLSKHLVGANGVVPLKRAKEASEATGRPIMVHIGDTPGPLGEILNKMRKGDILTHCFTGLPHGIVDSRGDVIPEARSAVERGVIFDVGHGQGSFSFGIAKKALEQGVEPRTISSDLHTYNINGPVFDLLTTASKFMHLGLSMNHVLEKVTTIPATFLGLQDKIGTVKTGAFADILVVELERGEFPLVDSYGNKESAKERLKLLMVMKGGKVHHNRLSSA
jgi:dihydroorotase